MASESCVLLAVRLRSSRLTSVVRERRVLYRSIDGRVARVGRSGNGYNAVAGTPDLLPLRLSPAADTGLPGLDCRSRGPATLEWRPFVHRVASRHASCRYPQSSSKPDGLLPLLFLIIRARSGETINRRYAPAPVKNARPGGLTNATNANPARLFPVPRAFLSHLPLGWEMPSIALQCSTVEYSTVV